MGVKLIRETDAPKNQARKKKVGSKSQENLNLKLM